MFGLVAITVAEVSCGPTVSPGRVADGPTRDPHVDVSVEAEGEGVRVRATVHNTTAKPIYVCETPMPRFKDREGSGPYAYYGGAETVVLWWGMVNEPGGPLIEESAAMHGATVRRIEPGQSESFTHDLEPVLREQNAWMLRLCDDASEEDETFRISKVMVGFGYWEHDALSAFTNMAVVPQRPSFWMGNILFVEDLSALPPRTYRKAVLESIREQQLGFERLLGVEDLQLTVVADPKALPRPLVFKPYWSGAPEAPPWKRDLWPESEFGEQDTESQ